MELLGQLGEGLRTKATSSVRGSRGGLEQWLRGSEAPSSILVAGPGRSERPVLPAPVSAPGEQMDSGGDT